MKRLIQTIEKMKPHFEKISNNPYLRAIRDGFISLIPVILFSSFFSLAAYAPNAFGFRWDTSIETILMKAYNGSMGILDLLMAITVTKSLTETFNNKLPKTNQIDPTSTIIAVFIGFIIIGVDAIEGGLSSDFMGTKGLLTTFVVGFIAPNIYCFCVRNNITVKMPEEVPGNISQTFKGLIPITLAAVFFWLFDLGFRHLAGTGFSEKTIELFQPIFSAADGYLGLALIFGAMAFFWFVGIHGSSIIEPAIAAIYTTNVETSPQLYQSGEHAPRILPQGIQYLVATLGGTGATLILTPMFASLIKLKQMKTVGRASTIPVLFGVNEPILFGAPVVLNPIFFIPFVTASILNVWIFKFFVDTLGMDGFIYNLPWATSGLIGLILGTGFAGLTASLVVLLLIVDFLIYFPFSKAYDNELVTKETLEEVKAEPIFTEEPPIAEQVTTGLMEEGGQKDVLVLCASGITSSILANAIKKGVRVRAINIESTVMAYGQYKDLINEFDLIVLAPQMISMFKELEEDVKNYKAKAVSTSGAEYVALTKAPNQAVDFIFKNLT